MSHPKKYTITSPSTFDELWQSIKNSDTDDQFKVVGTPLLTLLEAKRSNPKERTFICSPITMNRRLLKHVIAYLGNEEKDTIRIEEIDDGTLLATVYEE